jgi:hypothetical protein
VASIGFARLRFSERENHVCTRCSVTPYGIGVPSWPAAFYAIFPRLLVPKVCTVTTNRVLRYQRHCIRAIITVCGPGGLKPLIRTRKASMSVAYNIGSISAPSRLATLRQGCLPCSSNYLPGYHRTRDSASAHRLGITFSSTALTCPTNVASMHPGVGIQEDSRNRTFYSVVKTACLAAAFRSCPGRRPAWDNHSMHGCDKSVNAFLYQTACWIKNECN